MQGPICASGVCSLYGGAWRGHVTVALAPLDLWLLIVPFSPAFLNIDGYPSPSLP